MGKKRKVKSGNCNEAKICICNENIENPFKTQEQILINLKKEIYIAPKTPNQKELFESIEKNIITFVTGCPGSGKTFISVICALDKLLKGEVDRLIFSRPCIEAGGENLGFLPGDFNDKISPYMIPIFDFVSEYLEKGQIEELIRRGIIVTLPLAFQRGITFKNACVVLDESQNTTIQQMKMFLTRIGDNCKILVTGDLNQSDIKGKNGLADAVVRLEDMENVGIIKFTEEDILRNPIVKEIEKRYSQ